MSLNSTSAGVMNLYCAGSAFTPSWKNSSAARLGLPRHLEQRADWAAGEAPLMLSSQGELEEDEAEMESDSRGSTSPPETPTKDDLYRETRQLLLQHFTEYSGGDTAKAALLLLPGPARLRPAMDTLRRVSGDLIDKHRMAFQGMLTKLSIQKREDLQKLSEVPSLVFSDGITNWGRIVTLISFGAFLAKYLRSIHLEDCIVSLADSFTEFLMDSKREWITEQKGWVCIGFCVFVFVFFPFLHVFLTFKHCIVCGFPSPRI
ncbi:induced myeloid leukemia cell differentiation Mcl-1 [Pelobates cultripes]|uniref:Induced myeloid leukemia cell differentiation Mcl-1 n=1 Tax=Pelobates cultripes TaxID=61616 RepID=A0AAD1TK68_PELCU|nr:induced myeloid leukemia cell differentiation Mcl-1 [Pelobates cultripes]